MHDLTEDIGNITKISFVDTAPKLGTNDVLEIEIFGSGTDRVYEALTVNDIVGNASWMIAVAELLGPLAGRLDELLQKQTSREDLESWVPLIVRIRIVEMLLGSTGVPGSKAYALMMTHATTRLLDALRDASECSAGPWSTASQELHLVCDGCSRLAALVEAEVVARDTKLEETVFEPLEEGLMVNNTVDLARALLVASRAKLDMNKLEVGIVGERVAAAVRGPVRSQI